MAGLPDSPPPGSTPQPKAHPRAGRNLPAAIGVGLTLAAIIIGTLILARPWMTVVVAAAIVIAVHELVVVFSARETPVATDADGTPEPTTSPAGLPGPPMYVGAAAMQAAALFGGARWLLLAFTVTVLVSIMWRMRSGTARFVHDVSATVFTLAWVPLFAGFCVLMIAEPDGAWRTLAFIVPTVFSDIGGYVAGVLFGKHAMAPRISPKKSWEGFAGSTVACLVAGWLTVQYGLGGAWWAGLLLGLAAVVAGTCGDLVESMVKRDLGIKDMSNLLPGHGGMMDRLDSLLFFAPIDWLILSQLVPVD